MFYLSVSELHTFAIDIAIRVDREESVTSLRFQIPMCKSKLMHCLETLKDLRNHYLHLDFRHFGIYVFLQIAVFEVFHGDEDVIWPFEPSMEGHKKLFILENRELRPFFSAPAYACLSSVDDITFDNIAIAASSFL